MQQYKKNSLTLIGAVAMGTGVMIGAGIFALLGQMAELAGGLFPLAFLSAMIVVSFSAYAYVKLSRDYPSAGGIAYYLEKAYGRGAITAFNALLMVFSMVIAESFLARTFGSYTLQLFDIDQSSLLVPALGVALLLSAFVINLSGNLVIGRVSLLLALVKIGGIALFAILGLWVAKSYTGLLPASTVESPYGGFLAATALGILAFKGFTTITNSGAELVNPHRNVGRAIMISIAICALIYILVALAVASNLSLAEIVRTKNYSLAAAARPAMGDLGLWFTVILAIVATSSGVIASIFAVSRMLAMLTEMGLVPHRHFGMPGTVQKHALVYIVVLGILLTVFFELSRIAALGAIFYLVMDIAVQWGVFRHLRKKLEANGLILLTAIMLDLLVLGAFLAVKARNDMLVVLVALLMMILLFAGERLFLRGYSRNSADAHLTE
ncbi:MAG: APC family permease [Gammaproteobacteria bacterium]|jgi:amino acid transporter|nr:APC family permease [Gammaproteobacteria bacterium]